MFGKKLKICAVFIESPDIYEKEIENEFLCLWLWQISKQIKDMGNHNFDIVIVQLSGDNYFWALRRVFTHDTIKGVVDLQSGVMKTGFHKDATLIPVNLSMKEIPDDE